MDLTYARNNLTFRSLVITRWRKIHQPLGVASHEYIKGKKTPHFSFFSIRPHEVEAKKQRLPKQRMQKCATAPEWIFRRPANAGLLRGMQLGRISQTSTSSCWLVDADQSTEDNHGSKNAPRTTAKNGSGLLCAWTSHNTQAHSTFP